MEIIKTTDLLLTERHAVLRQVFITFYETFYAGWTQEDLGFPPSELGSWLQKQFAENIGEHFMVNGDSTCFLTYTVASDVVNIYQIIGNATQKEHMMNLLFHMFPTKPFYGVIRKKNIKAIDFFLQKGCSIVANRFPHYSSEFYFGLSMPASSKN